jgi:hypothetical protein
LQRLNSMDSSQVHGMCLSEQLSFLETNSWMRNCF